VNEPTRLDDVPTSHGSASDRTFAQQESSATTFVFRPSTDGTHPLLTAALSEQQSRARSRDERFDRVVAVALRGIVG